MHKSNKFAYANLMQFLVDVLFLLLSFGVAYLVTRQLTTLYGISEYMWILIIFIPMWMSIMAFRGMYDNTTFYYFDRVLKNVLFASFASGLGLVAMFFFITEVSKSALLIGIFLLLSMIIMFLERWIFDMVNQSEWSKRQTPRIIVVCSHETCTLFYRYLSKTHLHYKIIGVVQVGEGDPVENEFNLGTLENLGDILKNNVVDEVILALPKAYDGGVEQYVSLCEGMGITVHLILNLYDLQLSHVNSSMLGPLPMLTFNTVPINPILNAVKRLVDIAGSLVGIAITLVAAIFIVPAILIDSRGPAIFKQKRMGRYGRVFDLYKFRTMSADAESKKQDLQSMNEHKDGLMFKIKDDPRVTKVGAILRKTSLDELMQFFNVLKGDMSLVGTRPPTLEEVALYRMDHLRRISIKPGMTGMWQVSGRSEITDFEQVVALDISYIENWSVGLDISILFRTIGRVFKMKSAY